MSNISRRSFLAGAGSFMALGLAACGGSGGGDGADATYRIATDTTFPPFEYAEADGTYVGIDIDILAAVAEDQGFAYELDPLGFDAALQAVQSDQADGVIAGMSITEERKEVFDFSDPYFEATVCAACLSSSDISSLDDLAGQNVAVKTGTQSEAWALSMQDQYGYTTVQFDSSDVMYQDVIAGNTIACFEDTPTMGYAISTGNVDLKIFAECAADDPNFAKPYGFAVKKGANAELLGLFNAGLASIKDNGKYDEIISSWIG